MRMSHIPLIFAFIRQVKGNRTKKITCVKFIAKTEKYVHTLEWN